jgi:hypothetical protein
LRCGDPFLLSSVYLQVWGCTFLVRKNFKLIADGWFYAHLCINQTQPYRKYRHKFKQTIVKNTVFITADLLRVIIHVGQLMADVPRGLSLTPPPRN